MSDWKIELIECATLRIENEALRLELETSLKAIELSQCLSRESQFIEASMQTIAEQLNVFSDNPSALEVLMSPHANLLDRCKKGLAVLNALAELFDTGAPQVKLHLVPKRQI